MTVEQFVKDYLVGSGLFDDIADQIISLVKSSKANKAMLGRWQDDIEGYPIQMKSVLIVAVKRVAREWIAENKPMAWFRPIFE